MTENRIKLTYSAAVALAEVLRDESDRTELLIFCERVRDGHMGPFFRKNKIVYDLGVKHEDHS